MLTVSTTIAPLIHKSNFAHIYFARLIYSSSSLGKGTNNEDGILFVDKIAGVPVSATVDNIGENMAYQLQLLLPRESPPLHLASRLDVCTSGLFLFSSLVSYRIIFDIALMIIFILFIYSLSL